MIEISDIDSPNAQMSLYDELADEVAFPSEGEFVEVDNGFSLRKIHENCFVYGLDMLLTKEQVEDLDDMINSSYQNYNGTGGTLVTQAKYKWPNKTIPYTFNSNLNVAHREKIRQAIDVWHSQTQIKLVPRTNHKDYVEFIAGDGNSSYVGKIGGKQNITIYGSLARPET